MRIYTESRTRSRANWHREIREKLRTFGKALEQCLYTGFPEKAERWIFSTLRTESVAYDYIIIYRASSAEENDTKIIKFGWVILILWPFLEIRSFSNFAGFLRPMSGELWQDKPAIRCFCGSPLIRGNKRNTEQWASTGQPYGLFVPTKFFAHPSQKSSEIWKWPYFKKWS